LLVEPAVAPAQPGRIALAEMAKAIETLAAEQREALLLVVLEGLSYSEAAEVIGIPMGTLMSRLGRARAALRAATGAGEEPTRLRTVK
jgi:RNA polymerase sigma-70 factor (ECF subfamily)